MKDLEARKKKPEGPQIERAWIDGKRWNGMLFSLIGLSFSPATTQTIGACSRENCARFRSAIAGVWVIFTAKRSDLNDGCMQIMRMDELEGDANELHERSHARW